MRSIVAIVLGFVAWVVVLTIAQVVIMYFGWMSPDRVATQLVSGYLGSLFAAIFVTGPLMAKLAPKASGGREWIGVATLAATVAVVDLLLVFGAQVQTSINKWALASLLASSFVPLVLGYRKRWGWDA